MRVGLKRDKGREGTKEWKEGVGEGEGEGDEGQEGADGADGAETNG